MELLKRFRQGDPDAFEALFRQFQAEVYGWIVRIVRDPSAAEDLTVETFWRIHRARGRFDPGASFGAWARRIATNLAIDHLRQARREVALPVDLAQPGCRLRASSSSRWPSSRTGLASGTCCTSAN